MELKQIPNQSIFDNRLMNFVIEMSLFCSMQMFV